MGKSQKLTYAICIYLLSYIGKPVDGLRDSTAVKADQSFKAGVALNVDFMEELSQAVRLVREDRHCSSLANAMPHSAWKLKI